MSNKIQEKVVIIALSELTDAFAQGLGNEAAEQLLFSALERQHLPRRKEYTKEEVLLLLKDLQTQTGFVAILAGILLSRVILRNF